MVIKGKTKQLLVKQLKNCEKKKQELTDSIKRPNLRIMGIEGGDEMHTKEMCNIFNKIITDNYPNLEKTMYRVPPEHKTDLTKIELPHDILSLKKQITYKGKPIKIPAKISTETIKARRAWGEVFWALN
jgi:hypothetical protein